MDYADKELLRAVYYLAKADSRCFTKQRLQATRVHLEELGFSAQKVQLLTSMYIAGTIDFALALRAQYNWMERALSLGPCIAIYWTVNGPVFGVFGSKRTIQHVKKCGSIADLSCTPNLAKPLNKQAVLYANTLLKRFDIGFTVEELVQKVVEAEKSVTQ